MTDQKLLSSSVIDAVDACFDAKCRMSLLVELATHKGSFDTLESQNGLAIVLGDIAQSISKAHAAAGAALQEIREDGASQVELQTIHSEWVGEPVRGAAGVSSSGPTAAGAEG
jgi:hypothetical protein